MWTINTIDISIYDNGSSGSNNYSNSYMKKYLEEVVKVKMGVTSVSLPKWKGKDTMTSSEIGSYNQSALKYKKVTAYAETVVGSYKTLRNITLGIYTGPNSDKHVWLNTRATGSSHELWNIYPTGSLDYYPTYYVLSLRPAIEY